MRARGWQSQIPGHQVPGDRSHQSGAQDIKTKVLADEIDAHQIATDRFGDARAKDSEGHEIENCGPDYRRARRKHAGGNYGGDRIGGVVKAIGEIEDQCNEDDKKSDDESRGHGKVIRILLDERLRCS